MEKINFKKFKDGNKFLASIKSNPIGYYQWEYRTNCFLQWSKGLMQKQEGDKTFAFIQERGWVAY